MAMNSHQHNEDTTEYVVDLNSFIVEVREDETPYEVAKTHLRSDIFNAQIDNVEKLE
jgi:hypothetical protein